MEKWDEYLEAAIRDPTEQPVDGIVDAHTHIGHLRFDELPVTAERLIEYMDEHGVDRACVHSLESPGGTSYYVKTSEVLDAADRFPNRIVPWGSIDPRMSFHGPERFEKIVARHVERGIRGFGEIKCDLPVDHERLRFLYGLCSDHGLPVLLHIDDVFCTDEIGLPGLESVVTDFPEVDFIAHAPGWWAHVAADVEDMGSYPEDDVEEPGRAHELLAEYDNLHADFSMGSGFNALTRDEGFGQWFLEQHWEDLLFGSDYLMPGQTVPQFGFFRKFDLPDRKWQAIFADNVEELML